MLARADPALDGPRRYAVCSLMGRPCSRRAPVTSRALVDLLDRRVAVRPEALPRRGDAPRGALVAEGLPLRAVARHLAERVQGDEHGPHLAVHRRELLRSRLLVLLLQVKVLHVCLACALRGQDLAVASTLKRVVFCSDPDLYTGLRNATAGVVKKGASGGKLAVFDDPLDQPRHRAFGPRLQI